MGSTRRKRTRKRPQETYVFWTIQIERWDFSFGFGVNRSGYFDEPYLDMRHLEIGDRILEPCEAKIETAELTAMCKALYDEPNRRDTDLDSIGAIHIADGVLRGSLWLPNDALVPTLQILNADRSCYLMMNGPPLRYRKASIWHYQFDTHREEE